ncbi:hypothetical protein ACFP47_01855 [Nesterenkonia lacusekhoensis]|uniref:Lipoprotein n=1 Tax=Nesterenkonia lacusekhoensis TaxID=150832 RepID=A0ABS4T4S5_9MICC|nr:hypothetical protein [Nesterenkonia lacusekhoensis]MBP2319408.1 hypothetical protein [Nesterenkonia lacusekhoensis]
MEKTPAQTTLLRGGLGTAALAMLTLTACSADEPAEFEEGEPAGQVEETSEEDLEESEAPEQDEEADDESGSAGQEGPLDPEDAIETIVYEVPGESSNSVEVGLHSLRVVDEVMLLELSFTGEFYDRDEHAVFGMFGGENLYPVLNDRQNLKQYTLLGPSEWDTWSTDVGASSLRYESGQTAPYWGYYSTPIDDIDSITVTVVPGAIEFEDVEIDWDGNEPRGSEGSEDEESEDENSADDSADQDADARSGADQDEQDEEE